MALTLTIQYNGCFIEEIKTRTSFSNDINQFNLSNIVINEILRKYTCSKKIKFAKYINLTAANQGIKVNSE
jgi:hypothetical protein